MKFKIEVETTPEEFRESLGLPEIKGAQDRLVKAMEEKTLEMVNNASGSFFNAFMPDASELIKSWQKMFTFRGVGGGE